MPSQVLTEQSLEAETFIALLRAHAAATRRLNAQLTAEHGLTLSDFEVLFRLAKAPDRRMRRVDLAEQVVLTASGVTRLLDGLERQGYVERASCASDRRVVYAVITDEGMAKLRQAAESHFAQVDELFDGRYQMDELVELRSLLARLGGESSGECELPDE
jgi:DNA-binding MarR family transcriptional regulator